MRRLVISLLAAASVSLCASSSVLAADMPAKAPPVMVAPVHNWTGFYVGGHVGYAGGNATWSNPAGVVIDPSTSHNLSGGLGGLQLGYNLQNGVWVFGVEGDFSWADISGRSLFDGVDPAETKIRWLSTLTGRIGIANGAWLPYIKGGAVWANERLTFSIPTIPVTAVTTETRTGWTIGGGVEYAFTRNWSGRLEYDYMRLGDVTASSSFVGFPLPVRAHLHVVKFGVNYAFR